MKQKSNNPINQINLAASIGTLIEWAEFSFYGYLAYQFSKLFFPKDIDHAMLLSLTIFASSYIARPFGALVFGYIGDYLGRKKALVISLIFMGVATLGIGILPTYNTIGIFAPILLTLFRIIQGISISGEFTGAAIFVAEHHLGFRKSLAVSWICFSAAAGMMLGSLLATIVSLSFMPDWAWRIPFFLGFIGCLTGIGLRLLTAETPHFNDKNPNLISYNIFINLKKHILPLSQCFFIAAFVSAFIYICNMWWVSYAIERNYFNTENAHFIAMLGAICVVILTPIGAMIADKFTAKKILSLGLFSSLFSIPCIFLLTTTSNYSSAVIAQLIYSVTNILITGSMFRYLTESIPEYIRYTGLGFSWSLAASIFGGTAPLIAQYLIDQYDSWHLIYLYISIIGVLALLSLYLFDAKKLKYTQLIWLVL